VGRNGALAFASRSSMRGREFVPDVLAALRVSAVLVLDELPELREIATCVHEVRKSGPGQGIVQKLPPQLLIVTILPAPDPQWGKLRVYKTCLVSHAYWGRGAGVW